MEKLQPLIKHKYWIISGAALLLPLVGWWLSTSAVAQTIEQRWQELAGLNVPSGSNTPNQDYIEAMDEVNLVLDERQQDLSNRLYEEQKRLHTWPGHMATFMGDKKYREQASDDAVRIYSRYHLDEIDQMLKDIRRYRASWAFDEKGNPVLKESGVVVAPKERIPHVPRSVWQNSPPTSQEMWDTQEDVWLTRAILDAVNDVNADATKISDAAIREIYELSLRGGSRQDPSAGGQTMGGGGMDMDGGDLPGGGGFSRYSGDADDDDVPGMGGGGRRGFASQSLDVDLDALFGPDTLQTAGDGDDDGGGGPVVLPGGMGGRRGNDREARRRYVDDDPELPYKTRGFYLEVVMLHDKLPDLQAALVSMDWPTELLMVQQVAIHDDLVTPIAEDRSSEDMLPGRAGSMPGGRVGRNPGRRTFGARTPTPRFGANRPGNRFSSPFNRSRFGAEDDMDDGGGLPGGLPGGNRFGRRNPMGPMGGQQYQNPMNQDYPGSSGQERQVSSYELAMQDFYLAHVGIAGVMTIYRSPEDMEAAQEGPAQQAAPTIDPEAEPEMDPEAEPEPGVEPEPGAEPEPGVEPEPGAEPAPVPTDDEAPAAPTDAQPTESEPATEDDPDQPQSALPDSGEGDNPAPQEPPTDNDSDPSPDSPDNDSSPPPDDNSDADESVDE